MNKKVQTKVAIISGTYPPMKCGVGDYTAILSDHLAKQDMAISVITSKQAQPQHQSVKNYAIVDKWNWASIKVILDQLTEIAPDVILVQWPTAAYKRSLAVNYLPKAIKQQFPDILLLATLHELRYFKPWTRLRLTWLYQAVDHLILTDSFDQPYLPKRFKNQERKRYTHIPIGPPIPRYNLNNQQATRDLLRIEKNEILIGFFGFVNQPKGLDYLVDGLIELNNTSVKLLIIAELNNQNPYQRKIQNRIDGSYLKDKIVYQHNLSDEEVAKLLSCVDMAVLPFVDGVSFKRTTLLSCLNQGIPIITTNPMFGHHINFKHQETMWLVPTKNKKKLKEGIDYLINNPSMCKQLSEGAIRVADQFDWTDIAKKHKQLIYLYLL